MLKMSLIPSPSTALSLLCFLTTIVVLIRVGAAAFSANQSANRSDLDKSLGKTPHAQQVMFDLQQLADQPISLSQMLKLSLGRLQDVGRDNEKGRTVEYSGGAELVRMPASSWNGTRRPALLFRSPSPIPDQHQPLSMAKLIMSRHQYPRKPTRPPVVRKPPGLPASPSPRSRLVEEV